MIQLQYALQEQDYIQFYSFNTSRNPTIKKRKMRSWILLSVLFFGLGLYAYFNDKNIGLMIYSFSMSALVAVLYPYYFNWRYNRYYKKLIATQLKDKIGKNTSLSFNDNHLVLKDEDTEVKWEMSSFVEVAEVTNYLYLYINGGGAVIIPKTDKGAIQQILSLLKEHQVLIKDFN